MRTSIRPLTPLHYKSVKDMFAVFYKSGQKIEHLAYTWRHRNRAESMGIFNASGDLLGFALLKDREKVPGNLYLAYMAVHPAFKGFDLGSKLLKAILRKQQEINGSVHLIPLYAEKLQAWYVNHGFTFTTDIYMNFHSHRTRRNARSVDSVLRGV